MNSEIPTEFDRNERLKAAYLLARKVYCPEKLAHGLAHGLRTARVMNRLVPHESNDLFLCTALFHDIGASLGPYSEHARMGAEFFYDRFQGSFEEGDLIAASDAITLHGSGPYQERFDQDLFDADTLAGKAGLEGIRNGHAVAAEFGLTLEKAASRFSSFYDSLRPLFTSQAREMDMQGGRSSIGLAASYWKNLKGVTDGLS